MKKVILIAIIVFLLLSVALAAEAGQQYSPANAKVILNGKKITFDQNPILIDNNIFVQLRTIVDSLGSTIEWLPPGGVRISTSGGQTVISINKTTGYQNRQIFFMEQPPVIVKGCTMVSLRFMEVLGATVTWDAEKRVATIISDGNLIGSKKPAGDKPQAGGNYYKLYDIIIDDSLGVSPTLEAAKNYVLEKNLLISIENLQYTPIGYFEGEDGKGNTMIFAGGYATLIIGNDESGNERAIWLTKNKYTGYIETENMIASVLLKDGISKDNAISILRNKGVKQENIIKVYYAPSRGNKIQWFSVVQEEGKKYMYCLDFFTGDIIFEKKLYYEPPQ